MTKDQINRIEEMRLDGQGYVLIARELGVSENTVKSYCRRHPLIEKNSEDQHGVCAFCGKPVEQAPHRKKKRFCSDACRMKWWNSHADRVQRKATYEFTCRTCGRKFTAYGNRNRKYCSHDCYIQDRFGGGGHES